jgi:hypothetical protein
MFRPAEFRISLPACIRLAAALSMLACTDVVPMPNAVAETFTST